MASVSSAFSSCRSSSSSNRKADSVGLDNCDLDRFADVGNQVSHASGEVIRLYFRISLDILDKEDLSRSRNNCRSSSGGGHGENLTSEFSYAYNVSQYFSKLINHLSITCVYSSCLLSVSCLLVFLGCCCDVVNIIIHQ
ncbi:uncharacterized protein LOC127255068 [Andrographis paniculata]|uniref:uncharacterized protein LOC127255068 n=1 Tax=Andrographis paniculata TaxID=175694 RepID=UPI0021E858D2|nr:uncharacterized protein LOC127255068 [Andrographis paniculata]